MDLCLSIFIVVMMFMVGMINFWSGQCVGENAVYKSYCESKESRYEIINGVDTCVKDNKIKPIKWAIKGEDK